MTSTITPNILELLGAYMLGFVTALIFVWTLATMDPFADDDDDQPPQEKHA